MVSQLKHVNGGLIQTDPLPTQRARLAGEGPRRSARRSCAGLDLPILPDAHAEAPTPPARPTSGPLAILLDRAPWKRRHRRTVGHRGESEKPPEPEGPTRPAGAGLDRGSARRSGERAMRGCVPIDPEISRLPSRPPERRASRLALGSWSNPRGSTRRSRSTSIDRSGAR